MLLTALGTPSPVIAQQMPGQPSFGSQPQHPIRVATAVLDESQTPAPGSTFTLGITITVREGWKIQAGKGSGDDIPPYIPTAIDIATPDGWSVGKLTWPKAKQFTMGEGDYIESLNGYSGEITVQAPITVPDDAAIGAHALTITIEYQACDANSCQMPTDLSLRTTITLGEGASRTTTSSNSTTDVVIDPNDSETSTGNTTTGNATANTTSTSPSPTTSADASTSGAAPTFFGFNVPRVDGPLGLLLVIVLSMLAGFVLNLTPCVLPVIPIKIMTISAHAGSPGKSFALGLAMAAGVVAFWVGIGIPAAIFVEAADPSRLFSIWWVTLAIGVIIAFMALGIMGLFLLQLPQSVYAINPKADNALGSFLFGVMTGVLGLPCFGFAAGALLAGSAALPAMTIIAIFTSIGVGMAAPYLVLSAKPALVNKIPRTGPASELVKQIMGLLLLAAAAYFIGSGLIALALDKPYMARQIHLWAIAAFAAIAGLWLITRTFQITRSTGKRLAFSVIGLVIGGIAVLFAVDSTSKAKATWMELNAARQDGANFVAGTWNEFSPAAMEAALETGHVVVLDFTAEWCINCKVLKATVLNRDPVRSELAKNDVVSFTVDLTANSAPGWKLLQELGQTGIPQLYIYSPGSDKAWQSNAYTPEQVMSALANARSQVVAQK